MLVKCFRPVNSLPPPPFDPQPDEDSDEATLLCDLMLELLDKLSTAIGLVEAPEEMLEEIIDNSSDQKN